MLKRSMFCCHQRFMKYIFMAYYRLRILVINRQNRISRSLLLWIITCYNQQQEILLLESSEKLVMILSIAECKLLKTLLTHLYKSKNWKRTIYMMSHNSFSIMSYVCFWVKRKFNYQNKIAQNSLVSHLISICFFT